MDPVLTEQEQQFFQSGGQTELPAETPAEPAKQPESASAPAPEQPVPAAQPAQPAAPEKAPEQPRMVDYRALQEERAHNRELRSQIAQMQRQFQALEQRVTGQQQPAAPVPKFEENPAEFLRTEVETVKQQQAKQAEMQQQQEQSAQHQQRMAQFVTWYQGQAAEFTKQQPDFNDAYAAFAKARTDELQNAGLSPEDAHKRFMAEEAQLAMSAGQTGLNPARLIYQAALAKGYKSAPAQPAAPAQQPSLETVKRGVEAAKPLSSIGGGGQQENLTWEWVASVPDSEFLAAWKKMERSEARR